MKLTKIKSLAGDLVYSIAALVLMNGIIQIFVYPFLTKKMGAASFGVVLSVLSVVSVMASSFGTGANYSRMVVSTRNSDIKGDYNIFLLIISVISIPVSVITMLVVKDTGLFAMGGVYVLMIFSILRYYGDVHFRLTLDYKGFFCYYAIISIGYVIGVLLYGVFGSWCLALIFGELFATVFVAIKGNIYKRPFFRPSLEFKKNIKSMFVLSSAYLISNLVLNADRILLLLFVGSVEVTVFYSSTLIGKIIALLTAPLNGVIIGYLSKYKGPITKKMMAMLSGALVIIGIFVTLFGLLASHIFVKLMYSSVYEQAKPLFLIAIAGQILFFLAETYLVVVLRFTKEKLQLVINSVYAVAFFVVAIPAVKLYGIWGMAYAILGINVARFFAVSVIGIKLATGKPLVIDKGFSE